MDILVLAVIFVAFGIVIYATFVGIAVVAYWLVVVSAGLCVAAILLVLLLPAFAYAGWVAAIILGVFALRAKNNQRMVMYFAGSAGCIVFWFLASWVWANTTITY